MFSLHHNKLIETYKFPPVLLLLVSRKDLAVKNSTSLETGSAGLSEDMIYVLQVLNKQL